MDQRRKDHSLYFGSFFFHHLKSKSVFEIPDLAVFGRNKEVTCAVASRLHNAGSRAPGLLLSIANKVACIFILHGCMCMIVVFHLCKPTPPFRRAHIHTDTHTHTHTSRTTFIFLSSSPLHIPSTHFPVKIPRGYL